MIENNKTLKQGIDTVRLYTHRFSIPENFQKSIKTFNRKHSGKAKINLFNGYLFILLNPSKYYLNKNDNTELLNEIDFIYCIDGLLNELHSIGFSNPLNLNHKIDENELIVSKIEYALNVKVDNNIDLYSQCFTLMNITKLNFTKINNTHYFENNKQKVMVYPKTKNCLRIEHKINRVRKHLVKINYQDLFNNIKTLLDNNLFNKSYDDTINVYDFQGLYDKGYTRHQIKSFGFYKWLRDNNILDSWLSVKDNSKSKESQRHSKYREKKNYFDSISKTELFDKELSNLLDELKSKVA